MIFVNERVIGLYLGVWGETLRGRSPEDELPNAVMLARLEAQLRNQERRLNTRIEEWIEVFDARYGYEAGVPIELYSGPRVSVTNRAVDDPDVRAFMFLTVDVAIRTVQRRFRHLAEHSYVWQRADKDFKYRALVGEVNIVPKGRSLENWCKKSRLRVIRPAVREAIIDWEPETIVEASLWDAGLRNAG
jgi:hypothetical protein